MICTLIAFLEPLPPKLRLATIQIYTTTSHCGNIEKAEVKGHPKDTLIILRMFSSNTFLDDLQFAICYFLISLDLLGFAISCWISCNILLDNLQYFVGYFAIFQCPISWIIFCQGGNFQVNGWRERRLKGNF